MMNEAQLIAPSFLFRFSVPCLACEPLWSDTEIELPESHRLPNFGELDGRPGIADVRVGWSGQGIALSLRVVGKKQAPWCRGSRLDDSDGITLLIDTRDTHSIHRASRFCHRFVFLPQGKGSRSEEPVAKLVSIARAKENPKDIDDNKLQIRAEKRIDGYILRAAIPATAITGYDPNEHVRLGFNYVVMDRELGCQVFAGDLEMPISSDPSLWGTLELVT